MQISRLGPQELAAIHRLLQPALRFDRFSIDLLHEKLFENPRPGIDEYALWGTYDGEQLTGVMQSVTRPRDGRAWLGLFAVTERERRRGVGGALFARLLESWRAAAIHEAEVLAIPGNYFTPGLDPRYTAALCFVERIGFQRFKDCVNLIADLQSRHADPLDTLADEQRLESEGITIRRAVASPLVGGAAGDGALLDEFFNANFGADWRLEAERARRLSTPGLHLAIAQGKIIGFAAHSGMNREWGFFGPMGTAPAAEGRGIGRVLLRRCLADLRAAGHTLAVIPWVGPIGFYSRHVPCRVHRVFWRYRISIKEG
ncbi:MAG TPA: GNAT family N-acetyltransferase [Phycisphaerae bacterium]|jgi:GNAT superfamily N-acetyltransferase